MSDQTDPTLLIGNSSGKARPSRFHALIHRFRRIDGIVWGFLLLILLGYFVWNQRGEVHAMFGVLRTANVGWVLLMLVAAIGLHLTFALTQSSLLDKLGHRIPLWPSISTYAERQTVATIVPLGQAPSFVVLVKRFAKFGVTNDDAVFSVLLYSIIGYASFATFLIPVLIWLGIQGTVTRVILLAAAVLILVVILIAAVFVQVLRGAKLPPFIESRIPDRVRTFVTTAREHNLTLLHLSPSIALAFLGDVAGVACLFLALKAVGGHASIGVAVAGYTVGTLFLLVAPLFQGLGVVELSMTLLLQQLGVPAPQALGATLLYRLGEAWLPVVIGIALQARHYRGIDGTAVKLPAIWTGFNGVIAIYSATNHPMARHFRPRRSVADFQLLTLHNASRSLELAIGFLLVLLCYGLWKRRRAAWVASIILSAVVIVPHISKDRDQLGAIIAGINLVLLILYANRFKVRSDRPTVMNGLGIFAVALIVAITYGTFSLWQIDRHEFNQHFSLISALRQSLSIYFSFDSAGSVAKTAYANWLVKSFHLVGGLTVFIAVFALLRPFVWRHQTLPSERARAFRLISQYGDSSEDFFKYWPDKFFFFGSQGHGVVSYGVSSGVALVLGDPVARGDESFARTLTEFLAFADANGWQPAFHHATPYRREAYRKAGLVVLRIGAEAVIDLETFSLQGKHGKNFRNLMSRFQREGWRIVVSEPPQTEEKMNELRAVSNEWLTLEGRRERGFTLGQFTEDYVGGSTIVSVEQEDGHIAAFVNLIPDGVPGELTFDLMRHRVEAPNAAMDFLILSLIDYGKSHGYTRMSLGMVPFADAGTDEDPQLREQALALLTKNLDRIFAATTLFTYKDKFHPEWVPRYLVYAIYIMVLQAVVVEPDAEHANWVEPVTNWMKNPSIITGCDLPLRT